MIGIGRYCFFKKCFLLELSIALCLKTHLTPNLYIREGIDRVRIYLRIQCNTECPSGDKRMRCTNKYDSLSLSEDFEHYAVADNMKMEVSTQKAFHNKIEEISEFKVQGALYQNPIIGALCYAIKYRKNILHLFRYFQRINTDGQ